MQQHTQSAPASRDRRALPVVALGILVAVLPLVLIRTGPDSGPVGFAVHLMQGIAVLAGIGVCIVGLSSYQTGNLRPAVATGLTIGGLVAVGLIGGLIEWTGGPLVPIWAWVLSAVVVIGAALVMTYRFVD